MWAHYLTAASAPATSFPCLTVLCCRLPRSRSIPQPLDGVWHAVPPRMRPFPGGVPSSYPAAKLPAVENPALFEKLDTEALFFAFYYQPGSYQQYLAARELKRQSWRYHKQHAAWFQARALSRPAAPFLAALGTSKVVHEKNFVSFLEAVTLRQWRRATLRLWRSCLV